MHHDLGATDAVDRIAERAQQTSEEFAGRSDVVQQVGAIVREFGPLLPRSANTATRDRIESHLIHLASSVQRPGAFDLQRGWLYGYLHGRGLSHQADSPHLIIDGSAWTRGFQRGRTEGTSALPSQEPQAGISAEVGSSPVDVGTAPPTRALRSRLRLLQLAVLAASAVVALLWVVSVRSLPDAVVVLVGAALAAGVLVLGSMDTTERTRAARIAIFLGVGVLLLIIVVGAATTSAAFDGDTVPHGPLGGMAPTLVWVVLVIVAAVVQGRIRERLRHPEGRRAPGVRRYSVQPERSASSASAATSEVSEAPSDHTDEIGLLGTTYLVFGAFLRSFRYSPPAGRVEFWLSMLGLLLGATVISSFGALALSVIDQPIGRVIAFAPLTVAALWWMLALLALIARRLLDIRLPRALALVWLAAPGLYVGVLLGAMVALGGSSAGSLPGGIATAVTSVAVLVLFGVGAIPSRGGSATHPRITRRAVVDDLKDVAVRLRDTVRQLRSREVSDNARTGGWLFGIVLAFSVAVALPVPSMVRVVALIALGIAFSAVHIRRWRLQERYFAGATYTATYSAQDARSWKDPRWPRFFVRPFKVLGIVWIWFAVILASSLEAPGRSVALWVLLVLGYAVYLVLPAAFAIVCAVGVVPIVLLAMSLAEQIFDLTSNESGLILAVLQFLTVWTFFAGMFGLRMLLAGPRDRRTNQYWAYESYTSSSPW